MDEEDELPDETVIWRYIDLARFVLLISERTLRFTKLADLRAGDPYEGFCRAEGLPRLPKDNKAKMAELGVAGALYAEFSRHAKEAVQNAQSLVFVNSWCIGTESLGMWMLYGAQGRGVAIRSTIGQFKSSLTQNLRSEQYRFGKVNYYLDRSQVRDLNHDFTSGTVPASGTLWKLLLRIAFHKREAYLHEREWRAAIYQDPRDISGIDVPVDLDGLVSEVRVGPAAGSAEFDAVRAVILNGRLSWKPTKSDLLEPPV